MTKWRGVVKCTIGQYDLATKAEAQVPTGVPWEATFETATADEATAKAELEHLWRKADCPGVRIDEHGVNVTWDVTPIG